MCLFWENRYEDSFEATKKADQTHPNDPDVLNLLGLHHANLGDKSTAEKYFRQSISIKNTDALAWLRITTCKHFSNFSDDDIQQIKMLVDSKESLFNSSEKSGLYFALGKIYDDLKQYEEAIEYYFKANYTRKIPFNCSEFEWFSKRIINTFSKDYIDSFNRKPANPDFLLVSIVGMPRSGTSLVEQILACHSEIFAAGEVHDINAMMSQLSQILKADTI